MITLTTRLGWLLIALGAVLMLVLMSPLGMLLLVPGGMLVFVGVAAKALREGRGLGG
jgi:hypothetical protein